MAHVGSLDDVDHLLGKVLRVVADALDRLCDPDDLSAGVIVRGLPSCP
jgi:hypothetical protein